MTVDARKIKNGDIVIEKGTGKRLLVIEVTRSKLPFGAEVSDVRCQYLDDISGKKGEYKTFPLAGLEYLKQPTR